MPGHRGAVQGLSAGDPAQAILDTVGANPANLIVVGNRGLGAQEEQLLGPVPGDVVKNAVCDVLVVHQPAEASADGTDRVAAADPAGRPPTG
ncbi:universal stress protein [Modestobacter marinus]|uniref:universal stress protein n=1 Tax=Modestobacter marinus TaxID=477641 RepID=UPI001C98B81B|nr:universal stress protein [Modestobacter marinus]